MFFEHSPYVELPGEKPPGAIQMAEYLPTNIYRGYRWIPEPEEYRRGASCDICL